MQQIIHLELKAIDMPNYIDSDQCAITMALKRVGYSEWREVGGNIIHWGTRKLIADRLTNESYRELSDKVNGMFSHRLPAEDFVYDLVLEIAE